MSIIAPPDQERFHGGQNGQRRDSGTNSSSTGFARRLFSKLESIFSLLWIDAGNRTAPPETPNPIDEWDDSIYLNRGFSPDDTSVFAAARDDSFGIVVGEADGAFDELVDASRTASDKEPVAVTSKTAKESEDVGLTMPIDKAQIANALRLADPALQTGLREGVKNIFSIFDDFENCEFQNVASQDIDSQTVEPQLEVVPADISQTVVLPAADLPSNNHQANATSNDILDAVDEYFTRDPIAVGHDAAPAAHLPDTQSVDSTEIALTDLAPTDLAPIDVAPADVAPADVAPTDVAPADVAPADVAPADVAPTDVAPTDVAPTDVALTDIAPSFVLRVADAECETMGWMVGAFIVTGGSWVMAPGAAPNGLNGGRSSAD